MAKRYFLGYYSYFGVAPAPLTWVEHDGLPCGSRTHLLPGSQREITEEEWNKTLTELVRLYPYQPVKKPDEEVTKPTPYPGAHWL